MTVPEAVPVAAAAGSIEAALRLGEEDNRFVYARGELVPLLLRSRAPNVERMTIQVKIPKLEGKLLLFSEALPQTLELINMPATAMPWLPVTFSIAVRDNQGALLTTPIPLRLVLRDPEGHENREYSRRLITDNGTLSHQLTFAVNDLRGDWTIEVTDLLTGAASERPLRYE